MPRFYRSRHGLLSEFDSLDIELDDEMWFSVTPEGVATQHAKSLSDALKTSIVLDLFCGIGGDIIKFPKSLFAIGCDILESRLGVAKKMHARLGKCPVDFVLSDSMSTKSCFRKRTFDAVYLSPPWGHEGIRNRKIAPVFGRRKLASLDVDGFKVFLKAIYLAKNDNIAFFLPRGMDINDLHRLARMTSDSTKAFIEIHESFDPDDETNDDEEYRFRVRAITVYFGSQLAANKILNL